MFIETFLLKIAEKFSGEAASKVAGGASKLSTTQLRRFLNRGKLDFLASNEDFLSAKGLVEQLGEKYETIFATLDEMYNRAPHPFRFGTYRELDGGAVVLKLQEIRALQEQTETILSELNRKYPSVLIIIGKFMMDYLVYATFVPRALHTRGGLLQTKIVEIEKNFTILKNAGDANLLSTEQLINLRRYERLSHVLDHATDAAIRFMEGVHDGAKIPIAIVALSNFQMAKQLGMQIGRDREGDHYRTNEESYAMKPVEGHIQTAVRLLRGDLVGPANERMKAVNREAKAAVRLLKKYRSDQVKQLR
jgi:hypothetical protein